MPRRPERIAEPLDPEQTRPIHGKKIYLELDRFLEVHTLNTAVAIPDPQEIELDKVPWSGLRVIGSPVAVNLHVNKRNKPTHTIPIPALALNLNILQNFHINQLWVDIPVGGAGDLIILLTGLNPQPISRED